MDELGEPPEPVEPALKEPYLPTLLQEVRAEKIAADLSDVENVRSALTALADLQDDIVNTINEHIEWVNGLIEFAVLYNTPKQIIGRFVDMDVKAISERSRDAVYAAGRLFWDAMQKPE